MASADDPGPADVPRQRDPAPGTAFRAVARVRSANGGRVYTARKRGVGPDAGAGRGEGPDAGAGRGESPDAIARPGVSSDAAAGRGVAPVPTNREETRPLTPPPPPGPPVFVDDSGRRGRLLAWTAVAVALGALLLVVAFWIGLATSSGGP